jgi:hypothetical protein
MADVVLTNYTRATLPASPAQGTIVNVTDTTNGPWVYNGTNWVDVTSEQWPAFDVKSYGAVGNGSTNDIQAFISAIQAASAINAAAAPPTAIAAAVGGRALHENAMSSSALQARQRARKKPCDNRPQRR